MTADLDFIMTDQLETRRTRSFPSSPLQLSWKWNKMTADHDFIMTDQLETRRTNSFPSSPPQLSWK